MSEYVAIVKTLLAVIQDGKSLDVSWDDGATPLAKEITYGILRDYYRLGEVINQLVKKPLVDKHPDLHILMLAGLYSATNIRRPAYASVNLVVEATAALGKPWAKGLINGVLRNYLRNRDAVDAKVANNVDALTNHPKWMREEITVAWPEQSKRIFEANNRHAPMTLRVNTRKTTVADYVAKLAEADIQCAPGRLSPTALYLAEPTEATRLPGFPEGVASVQDEASQLVAPLLDVGNSDAVLDACAAPGGKACHIMELTPSASLTAIDINADRARQVRQNFKRIGVDAQVVVADLNEWQTGIRFERILLDAPCSATGIIRRHPDIKLLRRKSDIDKLVGAQIELLSAAWRLLKKGGVLVYSTCSVLPAENDGVVSQFLEKTRDAEISTLMVDWGIETRNGRQLLPVIDGHDGFYYARLVKRG